jgi:Rps23 Pro-64 3,4-dihydroxylase Tpa1-like proline 4-hydroxylase
MYSSLTNPDSSLKDFICTHEDAVDNDTCDLIMSEYKLDDVAVEKSTTVNSNREVDEIDFYRKSLEIGISHNSVISVNPEIRKDIDQRIFKACSQAYKEYIKNVAPWIDASEDSGYSLLIYTPGCYFKEHKDALRYPEHKAPEWVHISNTKPRQLSISIQLNENYEGGELKFFNGMYTIPKKKGSLIIFPSSALFPHQVCEVTSGTRYSIVTWFS